MFIIYPSKLHFGASKEESIMKDCINPVAYWQCISLTKGKCLHKGPCEPIDQEGNRYSMITFQEDGKTICYIRDISFHHMLKHPELLPEKKIADIIDAEAEQRKAHNAATRGRIMQRPKITEEPSPHPWLDPIIARAKFQNETIEKICGACPDCGECTIAKEPGASEQCGKLRKALV